MASVQSDLLERVAATARAVPPPIIDRFCEQLEQLPATPSQSHLDLLLRSVLQQQARDTLSQLVAFWKSNLPQLRPDQLAWALRAAGATDRRWEQFQSVELVWTGPNLSPSSLRRTEQALLDVIEAAERTLTIVTFAAYKIPQVGEALLAAAQRDVEIRFVAESPEASGGKVSFAGVQALGEPLRRKARLYFWPREQRPVDSAGHFGALHAKCAVADEYLAFISSANLTEHALNLNVELGVLIRGGELPRRISKHFEALMRLGVFQRPDLT